MAATAHPCRELPDLTATGVARRPEPLAIRSYEEVGEILGISWQAVWQGEQRALRRLASNPVMQRLFEELG